MASNGSLEWGSTTFPIEPLSDDACFNEDDFDFDDNEDPQDFSGLPPKLLDLDRADDLARLAPAERIDRLLANMYAHKRTLLAVISACREARPFESIAKLVDDVQRGARSVYTTDGFLRMLVDSGALEMVTAEGEPYIKASAEPIEVERDGVVYLEVAKTPEALWRATDAGLEALSDNDPVEEIKRIFAERETLRPSFALLLELCSREEGADIETLKAAVNERPEMLEKKKTAQFLVDYLSNAGALYYDADSRGWRVNEAGRLALLMLTTNEE